MTRRARARGGAQVDPRLDHKAGSVERGTEPRRVLGARARASSSAGGGTRVDVAEKTRSAAGNKLESVGRTRRRLRRSTPRRPLRPEGLAKPDINCLSCGKIYRCAPRDGAPYRPRARF